MTNAQIHTAFWPVQFGEDNLTAPTAICPVLSNGETMLICDKYGDGSETFPIARKNGCLIRTFEPSLDAIRKEDIVDASQIDDIDTAVRYVQQIGGIKDGGVAAVGFSNVNFDWEKASTEERFAQIEYWLRAERAYVPPKLTFEAFQASRKDCDDLAKAVGSENWHGDPMQKPKGFLYLGSLYIEKVDEQWPQDCRDRGAFYLHIERCEWISNDLADLERKLYDWSIQAGYGE